MLLTVYMKEPEQKAVACVLWMHGLGADAQDMAGLATELPIKAPVRHVFIDAPVRPVTLNNQMPMRAWYDIVGVNFTDREDYLGISHSEAIIREVFEGQLREGFRSEQIFFAGFSQGGAMALFTGLQTSSPIAGIIALSSYFPCASRCNVLLNKETPLFLGVGKYDPLVLPAWANLTIHTLQSKGFHNITRHDYPMEHSICLEEINDLAVWLDTQVALIHHGDGSVK